MRINKSKKATKKILSLLLVVMFLIPFIPGIKANATTIINPQFGLYLKKVVAGEQINAIDSIDGWWLIAESGKLAWISGSKTSYWNDERTGFPQLLSVDVDINVYEAQVAYNYKKDQEIQPLPSGSVHGWWKVKTPEGYLGWVDAGQTSYNSNGVLVADKDIPAYFTAKLSPKQKIKDVQAGEQINAIDSREGWWLIAESGKLAWISGGKTSYWNDKRTGFPQLLSSDTLQEVYEAGVDYVYSTGEKITVIEGSVHGWWKVQTPNGNCAWVYAGETSYDSNGNLIADTSLKAYFNGIGENTIQTKGEKVVAKAKEYIGIPYVWDGETPDGFDCSGFVTYVYRHFGINTPSYTVSQVQDGSYVSYDNLQPGDLVFFDNTYDGPNPTHVGIYIGNNEMIHAGDNGVAIANITSSYWQQHYSTARRLL